MFWLDAIRSLEKLTKSAECLLVAGKPSIFAVELFRILKVKQAVYDAMDDMPAFYEGISRTSLQRREAALVSNVDLVMASSTQLLRRWSATGKQVTEVPNGLDAAMLNSTPPPKRNSSGPRVLGYVGTIASWFDWNWILRLAAIRPQDTIRIIGPGLASPPSNLPANVEVLPACSHPEAVRHIQSFDVGLIPFLSNRLTESVDPIKYYEYRAAGIPVISTSFGEMHRHSKSPGTWLASNTEEIDQAVKNSLEFHQDEAQRLAFCHECSWDRRFDLSGLLVESIQGRMA
jgi:glycosyltransferase involved in cell wall biosynthesis